MPITTTDRQSAVDPTNLLPGTVIVALGVLVLRLWYLQVVRGDDFATQAEKRRETSTSIQAPRGTIVDRYGRPLATVKPRLAVLVVPDELEGNANAMSQLSAIIGEPKQAVVEAIQKNKFRKHLPFILKAGITMSQAIALEEKKLFIPGVSVSTVTVRAYPAGEACAHVVGYVGSLNKDDIERFDANKLVPPSFAGHAGVERRYDLSLVGIQGEEKVAIGNYNNTVGQPDISQPVPGDKLVLSIDLELQKKAMELLAGHKGAIVALKPRTGEVLCLASGPTFDPNLFTRRLTPDEWQAVGANPEKPLLNRATSGAFGPGSTLKMLTLCAAIRAGVVTPSTTFVCHRRMMVGNTPFRCLGDHGVVNYADALRESCNIFFANLALRLDRKQILEAAQEFGLGESTGIDLLSEAPGILPTDKLVESRAKKHLPWFKGDNMNLSVGQGLVAVTPIQMARYASILANNGVGYRPTLLLAREPALQSANPPHKFLPEETNHVQLPAEWWRRIREAMISVVENGTGHRAKVDGITIAAKTGSADWDANKRSHAWIIGYAPAEDPQIAFAIVVEAAGRGGTEAAPMAHDLIATFAHTAQFASSASSRRR